MKLDSGDVTPPCDILTPTELYTLKVSFMACELYLSKTKERKIGDPCCNCVILGKVCSTSLIPTYLL